ncbi:hypothetical protein AAFF_G00309480 [Aldrovandia affinis]|uniref:Uncharacterized protein n=1 Tax=Aldrovandia affinis TaxID=143900 RepID=A0AAD7SP40_9TELE|nr:hypothetical protein AAFF_G00309480 [Aldrovandia affinis]
MIGAYFSSDQHLTGQAADRLTALRTRAEAERQMASPELVRCAEGAPPQLPLRSLWAWHVSLHSPSPSPQITHHRLAASGQPHAASKEGRPGPCSQIADWRIAPSAPASETPPQTPATRMRGNKSH